MRKLPINRIIKKKILAPLQPRNKKKMWALITDVASGSKYLDPVLDSGINVRKNMNE